MSDRRASCAEVMEELPAYLNDPGGSLAIRRHLSRCPECRRELARYDALGEGLRELLHRTVTPPPELARSLASIPSRLEARRRAVIRSHVVRNRRAYLGGVAAVVIAGAAGAALQRRRRLAPA